LKADEQPFFRLPTGIKNYYYYIHFVVWRQKTANPTHVLSWLVKAKLIVNKGVSLSVIFT
jgi:hypothetical protein